MTEGTAPARNQGPTKRSSQLEYSDRSAPSQTGDQYKLNESRNGNSNAISQAALPRAAQIQIEVSTTEATATTAAPEPSDSDCRRFFTANH